jgi:hypothetical protein
MKYYDLIKESLKDLAVMFGYTLNEFNYEKECERLLEEHKKKMLKKQRKIKK